MLNLTALFLRLQEINCEVIACSTDSQFTHLAWINTPRKEGGLGGLRIPLLADKNMTIARAYDVLKEDDGIPFRGLYIIDANGILRQMTVNDLPVGRSVDEVLRLVQAFQFTDKHGEGKDLNGSCYEEAQQQENLKRPLSPESVQRFAPDAKAPRVRVPHDLFPFRLLADTRPFPSAFLFYPVLFLYWTPWSLGDF